MLLRPPLLKCLSTVLRASSRGGSVVKEGLEPCLSSGAAGVGSFSLFNTSSNVGLRQYHVRASGGIFGTQFTSLQSVWNIRPDKIHDVLASSSLLLPSPTPFLMPKQNLQDFYGGIKCSQKKGRRRTIKGVIKRFYRLDWGAWISAKPGRARHLWKQKPKRKNRLRHHMFRTEEQSLELDRMVTKYWIKKKYWVDDPYESYHTRDNFPITKGVQGIQSTLVRRFKGWHPLTRPKKNP